VSETKLSAVSYQPSAISHQLSAFSLQPNCPESPHENQVRFAIPAKAGIHRLLDKGVWIGGVDVGESWGNAQGRKAYTQFYKYVRKEYALSPRPCLVGQSRGGIMVYNWAVEHAHDVGCIAGIYPVTNLAGWPHLGGDRILKAYGMSEAELRKHLGKNNPIDRLAPLARAKVPIFHIHGDADKVVPLEQNTLELARRYKALGGNAEVDVVPGKGHEEVPEFFQSERLLGFLLRYLNPGR
jgi:predicted esterase